MSLAVGREPRKTAGNRMSKLLDAEEEDEFYKTTYGGFNDESGDDEYHGDHSDTEDEVDSDFDIDEGDEPDSDQEEDAPRRKGRVVTKAYKEPIKVAKPKPKKPFEEQKKTEKTKVELKRRIPQEFHDFAEPRKSVRQSTSEHTRKTNLRLQERQDAPRRRRGAHRDRPLTQEELLAEAKITAEANIRSLENYERLEADKKKQVQKKRRFDGPTVRYHSVLMPIVSHSVLKEENVDVEGLDQDVPQTAQQNPTTPSQHPTGGLCSRTYITFSDDEAFKVAFSYKGQPSPQLPVQEICPVTHKIALYRDPVTDIPYANARAFRIIREAYRKYVAAHGFPNTPGAATGLDSSSAKGARMKMMAKQGTA
ncbi:vacuolar protein sorting 72 homolog a [Takifugu rubripes]|uniref:Vacuolar protein sorting-associated protein 72 homolog n=1 Tax=Takifugu rubripes TaxID=31033 RepID=H2SQW8_TAKRU|nr:vacuolar protein sorting-associated protein 72 homolog [Takifugu rubripes]|eukprot:XP_003968978.1 PREDICTED: vacuolar protein sorting-associated protein 72 homolog [Takifugu rubripes]